VTPVWRQPTDLQGECLASRCQNWFCDVMPARSGWGVAKIEFAGIWAGVAEPLRALKAEVEREGDPDLTTAPDLAAVSGDALPPPASTDPDPERR
jgi:hypothetical protein